MTIDTNQLKKSLFYET